MELKEESCKKITLVQEKALVQSTRTCGFLLLDSYNLCTRHRSTLGCMQPWQAHKTTIFSNYNSKFCAYPAHPNLKVQTFYSTHQHTDCNRTEKARHRQHEHRIPNVMLKADLTKGICTEFTFQYTKQMTIIPNPQQILLLSHLDSSVILLHIKRKHSPSQFSTNPNRCDQLDVLSTVLKPGRKHSKEINYYQPEVLCTPAYYTEKSYISHTHTKFFVKHV